jgi:hypothetical protein
MNENLESNTHIFQYGRSNKIDHLFTLDLMHGLQSSFPPFDFQASYKVACSNTSCPVNTGVGGLLSTMPSKSQEFDLNGWFNGSHM